MGWGVGSKWGRSKSGLLYNNNCTCDVCKCKIPIITVRVQSQNTGSKLGGAWGPNRAQSKGATLHQPVYIINLLSHPCRQYVYFVCLYSNWGWQRAALGWQCRQYMFTLYVCMVIGDGRGQLWDGRGVWAITSGMGNCDGSRQDYHISKLCVGVKTMKVANYR